MPRVLIITDAIAAPLQPATLPIVQATSAPIESMHTDLVSALKQAIADDPAYGQITSIHSLTSADLTTSAAEPFTSTDILCPLTLNLPNGLAFPNQSIFATCDNLEYVQQTVAGLSSNTINIDPTASERYPTYWLPIVLTAKGPLYAELIGTTDKGVSGDSVPYTRSHPLPYVQPIHLADSQRQPLYELGFRLLKTLAAAPSVYLVQFSLNLSAGTERDLQLIHFDRLIPFPASPAIASLSVQTPDLFTCYWRCLTGQPIRDLSIR